MKMAEGCGSCAKFDTMSSKVRACQPLRFGCNVEALQIQSIPGPNSLQRSPEADSFGEK